MTVIAVMGAFSRKRWAAVGTSVGRLLSVMLFIALWEALSKAVDSPFMPSFFESAQLLPAAVASPDTYSAFGASLRVVAIGYVASVVAALLATLLCIYSIVTRAVVLPMHEFIRYIPVPALVPLALVWLGIGDVAKAFLIFVGTYFQLIFLFSEDLNETPHDALDTARTLGLREWEVLLHVRLAESLPRIWNSCRIAFAWAWSYLLVAELINSNEGVGFQLQQAVRFEPPRVLVWLFLIGLLGLVVDGLFRVLHHIFFPWLRVAA